MDEDSDISQANMMNEDFDISSQANIMNEDFDIPIVSFMHRSSRYYL